MRVVGFLLAFAAGIAAPAAFAQTDSPRTSTSVFDLQAQLAPIVLGTGTQYVSGTGVRLSGSATSGTASFTGTDAAFWVNNVVPSWNVDMPSGTGVRTEVRAVNGGSSTVWYEVARIGTIPGGIQKKKHDSNGYIDIDTLMLDVTWPRIEYRVALYTDRPGVTTPTLRLVSLCYADTDTRVPYVALPNPGATTSLAVPWRSQYWVPGIGDIICGPTSLSMAEHYYGCNLPTETVAADCYDDENEMYGNWPFIAQGAAKHGFKAYMFRANTQQPLRAEFAAGHAVIFTMAYSAGELTNSPISSTGGHLVLCVGVTSNGDYICNDPAGSDSRWDHVVYYKDQIAHVSLYHGGGVCIAVQPNKVYWRYPYYPCKSTDPLVTGTGGKMEMFARGVDGQVYRMSQTSPNGGWTAWTSMGGSASSEPVAVTNRSGGNAVFARFADGNLYYSWQNGSGGGWSTWANLGGPVMGKPSVGKSPDGRMDVFCRMPDGSVQHRWEDAVGGWQAWASLGGNVAGDPVAALNWEGREEVFVRGTDNQLYHNWQLNDGSWSGWASLGGPVAGEPAIGMTSDGRIEVFCRFADASMQHNWQTTTDVGTSWNGWAAYAGLTDSNLASGRTPAFIQELYARESTGQIKRSYQTSVDGGWSAWESLGGSAIGAPIIGHNDDGRLQLFIFQSDGRMWSRWRLAGGGWSSWTAMGSALFPEPMPPAIQTVSVDPLLAAGGDSVRVTARVTDNVAVAGVTANGANLTDTGGGNWSGSIPAEGRLGQHSIVIEARDTSGNTATESSAGYTTARVVALSNRSVWDAVTGAAQSRFLFSVFGRATVVNEGLFRVDDGSGRPVDVYATGHGLTDGRMVRVRGVVSWNGPSDVRINSAPGFIRPLD